MHAIYRFFLPVKIKISPEKKYIFNIFAQNIHCGYTSCRGGCNEYPQCMFGSTIKKNKYTPVNPVFLYKTGVKRDIYCTDMFS